jgi:hypothetical protein
VGTKVSSIENTLRERGYSEKSIEEIFKWYGQSTKRNPRKRKTQKRMGNLRKE